MNKVRWVLTMMLGLVLVASTSNAALSIDFVYNAATDVTTVNYSGTFDINLTAAGSGGDIYFVNPRGVTMCPADVTTHSYASGSPVGFVPWSTYDGNPVNWISTTATDHGGDYFQISSDTSQWVLRGPTGSVIGSSVSGWMTFAGKDLTEMGLVSSGSSGVFSGGFGTVNWSVQAVPEPASVLLIGLGGGLIALYRRFFGWV